MLTTPGFVLLVLIVISGMWRVYFAAEPIRRLKSEFSDDDWAAYQQLRKAKTRPSEMPVKFQQIATASDSIARTHVFTVIAIIGGIFAIIFFGWDLGLVPNQ